MTSTTLEKMSFLVVDDSFFTRELILLVLRSFGAIEALSTIQPDIIITDFEMSPMNGVAFTRKLRIDKFNRYRSIPILMITAHNTIKHVMMAREAGVSEFLIKPFTAKALYSRIYAMVYHPRQFVRTPLYFGPDRRRQEIAIDHESRRGQVAEPVKKLFFRQIPHLIRTM